MKITMFDNRFSVIFPDSWFAENPAQIRLGQLYNNKQVIDFRAVGGKMFAFWIDTDWFSRTTYRRWQILPDDTAEKVDWSHGKWAISFDNSSTTAMLDLSYLENQ